MQSIICKLILLWAALGAATPISLDCDATAEGQGWETYGQSYQIVCTSACNSNSVWGCPGTERITHDSIICAAATMQGVAPTTEFTLTMQTGGSSYSSCSGQNNVASKPWTQQWDHAFTLTTSCAPMDMSTIGLDGTFESMDNTDFGEASARAASFNHKYNSLVTGAGWNNGKHIVSGATLSPDTWLAPVGMFRTRFSRDPIVGRWEGLAEGMPASPNGGVFAAALHDGRHAESFWADVPNLEIGSVYTLSFYQANAGCSHSSLGDLAYWKINFGAEEKTSTPSDFKGRGSQVWDNQQLTFTATQTTQRLEFTSQRQTGLSWVYIAVDGIEITKSESGAPCSTTCDLQQSVDLVLVIDGSSSITDPDFLLSKDFAKDFASHFAIGDADNHMRISVVQFSTTVTTEIDLTAGVSGSAVGDAVSAMSHLAHRTNTPLGITTASNILQSQGRIGIDKFIVVLTDGKSNEGGSVGTAATNAGPGNTLMSVGVGSGAVMAELITIADRPDYVFQVASYTALAEKVLEISKGVCNIINNNQQQENSWDHTVAVELTTQGLTREAYQANKAQIKDDLASQLSLRPEQIQLSLDRFGWTRRALTDGSSIFARVSAYQAQVADVEAILADTDALIESLTNNTSIDFEDIIAGTFTISIDRQNPSQSNPSPELDESSSSMVATMFALIGFLLF